MDNQNNNDAIKMALWRSLSKKITGLKFQHVDFIFRNLQFPQELNKKNLLDFAMKIENILIKWKKHNFAPPNHQKISPPPPEENTKPHYYDSNNNDTQNSRINTVLPLPNTSESVVYRLVLDAFDRDIELYPQINPFQISLGNNIQGSMHNFTRMRGIVNETFTNIERISLRDIIFPKLVLNPDDPTQKINVLKFPYLLLFIEEISTTLIGSNELTSNAFCLVQLEPSSGAEDEYVKSMLRMEHYKLFTPRANLRTLTFTFKFPDGRIVEFPSKLMSQSVTNPIISFPRESPKGQYDQQIIIIMEISCACPAWSLPPPLIPA
tara:strand:+ start:1765 stop:2730 length:966 start_codon:yes stop_codon:yes gene_type:complete